MCKLSFDEITNCRQFEECKFHERNISLPMIDRGSLTDLITASKACGYLLICKKMATNSLNQHFVKLSENCRQHYSYQVWSGEEFLARLHEAPDVDKTFFSGLFPLCEWEKMTIAC